MNNLICLLLFLSLLLGGCRPPASPVLTTEAATTLPAPIPLENRLTLKACKVAGDTIAAECGNFVVPEDRTHPEGRLLELGLIVVRAQGPDPEPDPLFIIAGGPGAATTGDVAGVSGIFKDVNVQRDIVYLDQRGTNDKHRLTCKEPGFIVANTPQQQVDDWMKQCLAGLDGDPRFYTTAEAMRDLDEARAALGYAKINLYGGSYGAVAVQVYMRMFPERVRAAVMDHGTALDQPFAQALPRASQSALDQILTYCEQDAKCHAAYPDVRNEWQAILDRLTKGPVITTYTPPGATAPAQITLEDMINGAHNLMFASGKYIMLPYLIHMYATQEDWTAIALSLGGHASPVEQPEGVLLMQQTIYCFEPAWGFQPDEIARLNPDSYYRDIEVEIAIGLQKICTNLPKPDPALIYSPGKPAPLSALMLNSVIDPQNPPANMELALKEFTQSRIVIEPTEGHETSASKCRWGIIAQYLQQGTVEGLDISCMQQQKPTFMTGDQ